MDDGVDHTVSPRYILDVRLGADWVAASHLLHDTLEQVRAFARNLRLIDRPLRARRGTCEQLRHGGGEAVEL